MRGQLERWLLLGALMAALGVVSCSSVGWQVPCLQEEGCVRHPVNR
jgi:hypothetical protein